MLNSSPQFRRPPVDLLGDAGRTSLHRDPGGLGSIGACSSSAGPNALLGEGGDRVVEVLHHQGDDVRSLPPPRDENLRPAPDAEWRCAPSASTAARRFRRARCHRSSGSAADPWRWTLAVAARLDVGVTGRMDRGGDRHPVGEVEVGIDLQGLRADDRLRSWCGSAHRAARTAAACRRRAS